MRRAPRIPAALRARARALQRPWITALTLVVLLACAAHAGRSSSGPLSRRRTLPVQSLTIEYFLVRAGDVSRAGPAPADPDALRFRVIDPDRDSADDLARAAQETPGRVYRVLFTRELYRSGPFAPTSRLDTQTLRLAPLSASSGQDDAARAWLAARDALPDVLGPRTFTILPALAAAPAPELRGPWTGPQADVLVRSERTLWTGYLVNTIALAALVVLILSLPWLARVPAAVRTARREHALDQGRCPRCGYYIRTLPEMTCPECGWGREAQMAKAPKG